jgi:FdhD protein
VRDGAVSARELSVVRFEGDVARVARDAVAVEEPLEIRLAGGGLAAERSISVTMRTPGEDVELAVGYLLAEGVVRSRGSIVRAAHCGPPARDDGTSNVVKVTLADDARVDLARLERHFATTSACGLCGKTSLDAVKTAAPPVLPLGEPRVSADRVPRWPDALRARQALFASTGGLHAAGLVDARSGELLLVREDVGRHNAVDKLFGARLLAGAAPCDGCALVVSGRASFELVQKALMAGAPILAAVGAPSSLAVDLAREHGMTLLGFVRDGRFNVYAGEERLTS